MPLPNVTAFPPIETLEQERLWKLAALDAEQLLSRAETLSESRFKQSFLTSLELAMVWYRKAVAAQNFPNDRRLEP